MLPDTVQTADKFEAKKPRKNETKRGFLNSLMKLPAFCKRQPLGGKICFLQTSPVKTLKRYPLKLCRHICSPFEFEKYFKVGF
jgi:hypothetical protein